jgi:hypothetical protein
MIEDLSRLDAVVALIVTIPCNIHRIENALWRLT